MSDPCTAAVVPQVLKTLWGFGLQGDEWQGDFLCVDAKLVIAGGKGGFGSMLKSAKGGAKSTSNFGANRDLNGRRLRHVEQEKEAIPQPQLTIPPTLPGISSIAWFCTY